ncbi:hypothetical protein MKW94_010465 [Papaver nudicaule]|uniref:Protein kinase domain-containing protein n=1 Tax=Papaver nudicaule TaxID=74823 RepID=A0AA41VY08_PAPNU|nr:hypothetical protein [Papaver nudicaule]
MDRKNYPIGAENYTLLQEIGHGSSSTVFRATCEPLLETVAIKVLDFEKNGLDHTAQEAQTMILVDHPNLQMAHCSFVADHYLWIVMPFMAAGSCLHIMKTAFPQGYKEAVIATILRGILRGLEYMHHHGDIHRDVKAGNILVDSNGAITLSDFGVSASLYYGGDRHSGSSFRGTPCWMAPEVIMEQNYGYNFKADIWSFGITALELAHGHAPFSESPPSAVLLMTLQRASPGLDQKGDEKFSKSFREMIAMCLMKDPRERPSAQRLLKHSFFKKARSNDYIVRTIVKGLPTILYQATEIVIREEQSTSNISAWNFDVEDLKTRASQLPRGEASTSGKDQVVVQQRERCEGITEIRSASEEQNTRTYSAKRSAH